MKTYTVLYAEDVPHYGTREFQAADDDLAIQRAIDITPDAMSKYTDDPDHNNTQFRRIVHIEGPNGTLAEGIYLDQSDMPAIVASELLLGLKQAIRAMNNIESFDTGLVDKSNPQRTISSYKLLPALEAIVRKAEGQQT